MSDDRSARIQRLRAYRQQLAEADRTADTSSLDRAADLVAEYEAKEWVAEVEPPKTTHFRGRPTEPESWSRFAGWVKKTVDLAPRQTYHLRAALDLAETYLHGVQIRPEGEYVLRPLTGLVRKGYGEAIPKIWADAVDEAGGAAPDSGAVRAALSRWKKANLPTVTRREQFRKKSAKDAHRRMVQAVKELIAAGDATELSAAIAEAEELILAAGRR